jgi:hypothetical protein
MQSNQLRRAAQVLFRNPFYVAHIPAVDKRGFCPGVASYKRFAGNARKGRA